MSTESMKGTELQSKIVTPLVIVAALGYFVDIFDLLLFSILRVPSLTSLGYTKQQVTDLGLQLLNWQMAGMLIGGLLWGVMGDRKGRIAVLFGSILLYSVANIANGLVQNYEMYAVWRFLAGVGLAGELGAGITLVAETVAKEKRGYSTTLVATVGVLGAVVAAFVAKSVDWRTAYFIGGGLGLGLLVLRITVYESGMFERVKTSEHVRGSLKMLFADRSRLMRYLHCILCGLPIWFVVGIFVTLAPEFGEALGVTPKPNALNAVLYCYIGLSVGDLLSGLISQWIKSRKKAIMLFIFASLLMSIAYLNLRGVSEATFNWVCIGLGIAIGYWAVFVTTAAEQFGTNLRATVATSVPNFIRGSVIIFTLAFAALKPSFGILNAGMVLTLVACGLGLFSTAMLRESFGQELDFVEA
ncbi:MAG: MFS transporter [Chthonomonas sp.]|nr:MFS transporter [Chthonomonas sp.]